MEGTTNIPRIGKDGLTKTMFNPLRIIAHDAQIINHFRLEKFLGLGT